MSETEETFKSAYTYLNTHPSIKLSNNEKLELYACYKSATVGPCNTSKPSLLDFVGRAKWDAWNGFGNMDKQSAMVKYIEAVERANVGWRRDMEIGEEIEDDAIKVSGSVPPERGFSVSTLALGNEDDRDEGDESIQDIFFFTKRGNAEEVSRLLGSGDVDLNAKDSQGLAPLHWACDRGHLDIVNLLLEKGADVNVLTDEQETPLHYACISERLEVAQSLNRHGADTTIRDEEGLTAFEQCGEEFREKVTSDEASG